MALTSAERQARYAAKAGTGKIRQLADGTWVWHSVSRKPIYATTRTALLNKIEPFKKKWRKTLLGNLQTSAASLNLARDNVDQWTKNWFTKNLNKFGIRDVSKALTQLKKDWASELKANPGKYTHPNFTGVSETGFPKVTGSTITRGRGEIKSRVLNPKAVSYTHLTLPTILRV